MAFWSTTFVHVAHNAAATLLFLAATNIGSPQDNMPTFGRAPIAPFPAGAITSSLSIEVNSKGEMIVDAYTVEFGELVESVFKRLPEVDKAAAPSVAGDAAVLKKKVSGRCVGHSRAELIDQLQVIGSCVIKVNNAGTRAVITDSGRRSEPSGPPNSRSDRP
jgi:hypothetical protein